MRTLTLLTALLLLAFQAQAETLQETAVQVPAQDQPEVEHQHQPGDDDQDVAVSFTEHERFARQLGGLRKGTIYCSCVSGRCPGSSRPSGTCTISGRLYTLCCR